MEDVEQLIADMTVAEKVGQMTQASNTAITESEVADLAIGSVLSGGNGNPERNNPSVWSDMVGGFRAASGESRLGIPILYGVDAVHGHSNVGGATIYPHNIGLGAAGDEDLVRRIGSATATEMLATGVDWAFAPCVAVPQDIRWGRTYEGYGKDVERVSRLGAALIEGLQGTDVAPSGVMACAKHYLGDGATTWGTAPRLAWTDWWDGWGDAWQIDQGDVRISEAELRSIHLPPYERAIEAGVMSVMASYSSWQGKKVHGHRGLLTGLLKSELGFAGFVVSDWMGIDQIAPTYEECVIGAIEAGIDMVMVPDDYRRFIAVTLDLIAAGRIAMSRIDDAVRRILRTKVRIQRATASLDRPGIDVVGCADHRSLAAEAVRRSAVLLSSDGTFPLISKASSVDVAGSAADDIGLQCGGWTVGWQGGEGATTAGTTLLAGLRTALTSPPGYSPDAMFEPGTRCEVGVVCLSEPPYAEGPGDRAVPGLSAQDRALFERMRRRSDRLILMIYSGRPLLIPDLIDQADAVVAAWLPGSEAAALADLLVGRDAFTASTPQPWPSDGAGLTPDSMNISFPVGHGLVQAGTPKDRVSGAGSAGAA